MILNTRFFAERDAVATIGTFIICIVFNVEAGLLLGIVSNVVYLLYLSARPSIVDTECTVNLYKLSLPRKQYNVHIAIVYNVYCRRRIWSTNIYSSGQTSGSSFRQWIS